MPVRVRTALAPVAVSSALGVIEVAVRAVKRFGEMPCTSVRVAMSITRCAGNSTDSAVTEV